MLQSLPFADISDLAAEFTLNVHTNSNDLTNVAENSHSILPSAYDFLQKLSKNFKIAHFSASSITGF